MAFAVFYKTYSRAIPAARAAKRWFALASERELRLDRLAGEYQGISHVEEYSYSCPK